MNKQLSKKIVSKLLPKTVNNPGGFTLVELLVTISILAILAIIGFALFQDAQKRARDSRRREEVQAIANAWEVNYSETTASYPVLTAAAFSGGTLPRDPLEGSARCNTGTAGSYTANQRCSYCVRAAGSAGSCGAAATDPTFPAVPATAACPTVGGVTSCTSWYVCTNLEKPDAAANEAPFYCRANQR